MENWEAAARKFLTSWGKQKRVISVVACGSYVTGHPSPRSDVDLVIVVGESNSWRERGNRIVDGFLIEYFANPPGRLRAEFEADHRRNRRVTATMFRTGRVLFDSNDEVRELFKEAGRWLRRPFAAMKRAEVEASKYGLWDGLDNTCDAAERNSPDFAFQYQHAVRSVCETHARFLRQPILQAPRIWSAYSKGGHPERYLLDEFPDSTFIRALIAAMRSSS